MIRRRGIKRFKNLIMLVVGVGVFLSFEAITYKYSTNEHIKVLQSELEKTSTTLEETQAELDESYQQLDEIIDTVLEDKQKIEDLENQLKEKEEELQKLKRPVIFNSYDVTESPYSVVLTTGLKISIVSLNLPAFILYIYVYLYLLYSS